MGPVMALLLSVASPSPWPIPTRQLFDAAIKREASGDLAGAATALEALGRARPADPYADDALFEAAQLYDERLDGPEHARALYAEILARYPGSRLARRAQHRVDDLTQGLASGGALLVAYQHILADGAHPDKALPEMEAFVAAHPDFALIDHARFWLGERLTEAGQLTRADARYAEIEAHPGEMLERAQAARAKLAILQGRPFAARAIFTRLLRSTDPLMRSAAKEGLDRVDVTVDYDALLGIAVALIAAWLLWMLVEGRGQTWAPPVELYYYLPVALVFLLAAATENRAITVGTVGMASGGVVLTWLSARGTSGRLARRGPMARGARWLRASALALATLAVIYAAVFAAGLLDLIWATFRFGPDR